MESIILTNARLILRDEVIEHGTVAVAGARIVDLDDHPSHAVGSVDCHNAWVMPGIVDLHSDALEMEIQPRPNCLIPIPIAIDEFERKLLACGVTTIYHGLSVAESTRAKQQLRGVSMVDTIIREISAYQAAEFPRMTHAIHLRFEVSNQDAVPFTQHALRQQRIQLLSFMDHTPGQGQFRELEHYHQYLIDHRHVPPADVDGFVEAQQQRPKVSLETVQELADFAFTMNVPVASHDDDTVGKLALLESWRGRICEFPVSLDVALQARNFGVFVAVGAPNLLNGGSTGGNLSARDAIKAGAVDILLSDYYPPSLIHAVFALFANGMPLAQAVRMVTHHPAQAANIDGQVGSIDIGKNADLLIIDEGRNGPRLQSVMTRGRWVSHLPS